MMKQPFQEIEVIIQDLYALVTTYVRERFTAFPYALEASRENIHETLEKLTQEEAALKQNADQQSIFGSVVSSVLNAPSALIGSKMPFHRLVQLKYFSEKAKALQDRVQKRECALLVTDLTELLDSARKQVEVMKSDGSKSQLAAAVNDKILSKLTDPKQLLQLVNQIYSEASSETGKKLDQVLCEKSMAASAARHRTIQLASKVVQERTKSEIAQANLQRELEEARALKAAAEKQAELLKHQNAELGDMFSRQQATLQQLAMSKKSLEVDELNDDGYNLLHLAIIAKDPGKVRQALDSGADANRKTRSEQSPLSLTLLDSNFGLKNSLDASSIQIVSLLLHKRADPSERTPSGRNFIHLCVFKKAKSSSRERYVVRNSPNIELVKLLLLYKCDFRQGDLFGDLRALIEDRNNNTPIAQLLRGTMTEVPESEAHCFSGLNNLLFN